MAYRRRRKRARKETASEAAENESASEKRADEPAEQTQDDRVPAGQQDLPPEGADAEDLDAVHDEACERYEQA